MVDITKLNSASSSSLPKAGEAAINALEADAKPFSAYLKSAAQDANSSSNPAFLNLADIGANAIQRQAAAAPISSTPEPSFSSLTQASEYEKQHAAGKPDNRNETAFSSLLEAARAPVAAVETPLPFAETKTSSG
ncbi:MAG: hypothetical protein ACYC2R_14565 [Burkholderiales bacterium]